MTAMANHCQGLVAGDLALVLSADVIEAGLQRYLRSHGIEQSWGMHERFLICLTPRANFEKMIASAKRSAECPDSTSSSTTAIPCSGATG